MRRIRRLLVVSVLAVGMIMAAVPLATGAPKGIKLPIAPPKPSAADAGCSTTRTRYCRWSISALEALDKELRMHEHHNCGCKGPVECHSARKLWGRKFGQHWLDYDRTGCVGCLGVPRVVIDRLGPKHPR